MFPLSLLAAVPSALKQRGGSRHANGEDVIKVGRNPQQAHPEILHIARQRTQNSQRRGEHDRPRVQPRVQRLCAQRVQRRQQNGAEDDEQLGVKQQNRRNNQMHIQPSVGLHVMLIHFAQKADKAVLKKRAVPVVIGVERNLAVQQRQKRHRPQQRRRGRKKLFFILRRKLPQGRMFHEILSLRRSCTNLRVFYHARRFL